MSAEYRPSDDQPIQRILDATNGGLDIILSLYPEAEKCQNNNKHFKLRESERTASATLSLGKNGNWYVKDFGSDFKGSGINLFAWVEGIPIKEAIKVLGARYNCLDSKPGEAAMPVREKRPATELEQEGQYFFEIKDHMSDFELNTLFAKAAITYSSTKDNKDWSKHLRGVCAAYGFFALTSFTYIKDRTAIITKSTDTYPIFMIDAKDFKKIYQPKSLDKKYRFRYFGTKDQNYIFGMARFNHSFDEGERKWLDEKREEDEEEKKPFQLKEVIICSGDRDSLNVAALGYNVIWLNSESAKLEPKVYNHLKKQAKDVYNLPDLDSTGVKQGHELAMFYLDLKTIQLPAELMERKDWRGNPCKDVRDYLSHYTRKDFEKLVDAALEYQFWDEEPQFDRKGVFKHNVYVFNNVRAYNFIQKCGFHRVVSKTSKDGYDFVQVKRNVVKVVEPREIKDFVNAFLEDRFASDQKLRNTMLKTPQLKQDSLENLKYREFDFKYYDKDHQYLFFENKTWKVTATDIIEYRAGEINKMVWESKVISRPAKVIRDKDAVHQPPFRVTEKETAAGVKELDIEILRMDCLFLRYLVNTSRVHWRRELEDLCELEYKTDAERSKYREENKFNIAGRLLKPEEIQEQKRHLINKIYVLGYLLARHKEKSKPWAPFLMDHKLSDEGVSNGGSGKTIFARSVEHFMNFLLIDGKSKSLTDDKHAFENVTEQTEVILIDDLSRYINLETFFSMITEGITVNPKYNQRFVIDYKDAPKIIFSSNFGVKDITSSAERRLIYAAFCDYYHNNYTGAYREDRTPNTDFGKDLFNDFTDEEWNQFFNTMAAALQVYFQIGHKVDPPMDNVQKRNLQGIMGDAFLAWADVFFSEGSGKIDTLIPREEAYQDFLKQSNQKMYSASRFMPSMEAWCKYHGYALNPFELKNNGGRIIRKVPLRNPDGSYKMKDKMYKNGEIKQVYDTKSAEMLYVKTKEGSIDMAELKEKYNDEEPTPVAANQTGIFTGDASESNPLD